jgi:hypothetical protein
MLGQDNVIPEINVYAFPINMINDAAARCAGNFSNHTVRSVALYVFSYFLKALC